MRNPFHKHKYEAIKSANIPFYDDNRELIGTFTLVLYQCRCGDRDWSGTGQIEQIDEFERWLKRKFDR